MCVYIYILLIYIKLINYCTQTLKEATCTQECTFNIFFKNIIIYPKNVALSILRFKGSLSYINVLVMKAFIWGTFLKCQSQWANQSDLLK